MVETNRSAAKGLCIQQVLEYNALAQYLWVDRIAGRCSREYWVVVVVLHCDAQGADMRVVLTLREKFTG